MLTGNSNYLGNYFWHIIKTFYLMNMKQETEIIKYSSIFYCGLYAHSVFYIFSGSCKKTILDLLGGFLPLSMMKIQLPVYAF